MYVMMKILVIQNHKEKEDMMKKLFILLNKFKNI